MQQEKEATDDLVVAAIVEMVREDIISGRLAPGADINSVELAARSGTSRTPVREALLILDRYGLVTLAAYKRPRVASVTAEAIEELYDLRRALHAYVSGAVIRRASDEDLTAMHRQAQALRDGAEETPLEQQFQKIESYLEVEYALCGNSVVIGVLNSLRWRIGWFRRIARMTPSQMLSISEDRLRAAKAYLERDTELATALNDSMLRRGGRYSRQNFVEKWASSKAL